MDADELTSEVEALRRNAVALSHMARDEDLGRWGDLTGRLVQGADSGSFNLVQKAVGVFAGRQIAGDVLHVFDERIVFTWQPDGTDGALCEQPPAHLATLTGPVDAILAVERTLLNFLQRLSGIATTTRRYVDAVQGTAATILDTRKTTPGWRLLEKYAVRCGGGSNHRMGLYDAVLIKDNHLSDVPDSDLAEHVTALVRAAQAADPRPAFIEVEADTWKQVEQLLHVPGVDYILLDNLTPADIARAVELRSRICPDSRVQFEVSGGVTLETVRAYAEAGVERISVGALTHSSPALDLSLERC
jgi:nicotinate-nucleotide pyrophosphorylase (carboxylating)